jgi:hypothetical protein
MWCKVEKAHNQLQFSVFDYGEIDAAENWCSVRCGERKTPAQVIAKAVEFCGSADDGVRKPLLYSGNQRLCLHPKGFTPQVMNYSGWRRGVLKYLEQQVAATADPILMELLEELKGYPKPDTATDVLPTAETANSGISIPLRLMKKEGELSFIGTVTVFGTPIDVTLSELAIESFFPADEQTADILASCRR